MWETLFYLLQFFGVSNFSISMSTSQVGKNPSFGVIGKIRAGDVVEQMVVANTIKGCSQF